MIKVGSRLTRGHWYGWIFWGIAASFFLYEQFVWVMPSVILVDLARAADASPVKLVSALSVYLWIYALLQLVVGGLFDRFGAKFILSGAVAICAVSCLLFGTATDLSEISVARGISGFGSAFAFVGTVYVATIWFRSSRLALIVGITTAVGMLGQLVGQTPLVAAVKAFGWREVVVFCSWPGLALAGLILLLVPRRPAWFEDRFAKADKIEIGIVRGIVQVLSHWQMWAIGTVCAVLYLPLSVLAALWGNTFMETAGGYSAEQASFATLVLGAGWLIGCPIAGVVSDRIGSRKGPLLIGIVGGGAAMFLLLWPSLLSYGGMLAVMFVGGLFTSVEVICFAVAMELAPRYGHRLLQLHQHDVRGGAAGLDRLDPHGTDHRPRPGTGDGSQNSPSRAAPQRDPRGVSLGPGDRPCAVPRRLGTLLVAARDGCAIRRTRAERRGEKGQLTGFADARHRVSLLVEGTTQATSTNAVHAFRVVYELPLDIAMRGSLERDSRCDCVARPFSLQPGNQDIISFSEKRALQQSQHRREESIANSKSVTGVGLSNSLNGCCHRDRFDPVIPSQPEAGPIGGNVAKNLLEGLVEIRSKDDAVLDPFEPQEFQKCPTWSVM